MTAQLTHDDPRLGLRPAEARADDPLTGVAMRLLGDALTGSGDECVCAPALGVPVRLLALRRGADLIHVLEKNIPIDTTHSTICVFPPTSLLCTVCM